MNISTGDSLPKHRSKPVRPSPSATTSLEDNLVPFQSSFTASHLRTRASSSPTHLPPTLPSARPFPPGLTQFAAASFSNTAAAPIPVPMHMLTTPHRFLVRRISCSSVAICLAPVAPKG